MSNIVNVGSIEEDIKILESMLEEYENCSVPEIDMQVDVTFGKKQANAIKTLLGNLEALCDMQRSADRELKRQKQINEEHQNINGELREEVKELEDKYILEKVAKEEVEELLEDSIPKQKIKEKIEEVKQIRRELGFKTYLKREHMLNEDREIVIKIQVLQELLQESEDK